MIICVLDTETIGKVNQDLLNLGYKIVDIDMQDGQVKTLCQRDYIVGKLFNNTVYMLNDDFVGYEKYAKYVNAIKEKTCIKRSLKQMLTTFKSDLQKYNVVFSYAYNNAFDLDKIKKACDNVGIECPINEKNCFDIWAYALDFICRTDDYKNWALDNNQLTASEVYISTTVESVTRYLNGNIDFVEDHTALSDTQHETKILQEVVKRGCDITRPLKASKFIASDKVFTKKIKMPDGQIVDLKYKKTYERNGVITYK